MIVYVESNFVLELALLQEQHRSCEELLRLVDSGRIRLAVPAFSLTEPYETLIRYAQRRQAVAEELRRELRQLGRSAPYEEQSERLSGVRELLVQSQEEEKDRLQNVLKRLLEKADIISLSPDVISIALRVQEERDFAPQDSVVYASVLEHLSQQDTDGRQRIFLNRNSKDFDDPDVVDELSSLGCKVLFSFDDGLDYVRAHLES